MKKFIFILQRLMGKLPHSEKGTRSTQNSSDLNAAGKSLHSFPRNLNFRLNSKDKEMILPVKDNNGNLASSSRWTLLLS